jgi:cytochrome P450
MIDAPGCPFRGRNLPVDGTPLRPSPTLAEWRREAPVTPLDYPDGHTGAIVTGYSAALKVLSDDRFVINGERLPVVGGDPDEFDEEGLESLRVASLLGLHGEEHLRLRRAVLPFYSLRAVRSHRDAVAAIVREELNIFLARDEPADLFEHFAEPVSSRAHRLALGVPDDLGRRFDDLVLKPSSTQAKFDFVREVIARKHAEPGDDLVSRLIAEAYTPHEIQGLFFMLMVSGRESVSYLIATMMVALLTRPDQLGDLRAHPDTIPAAIEEVLRLAPIFLTMLPRTASEDIEIEGVMISAGQSVAVSPAAANRDPSHHSDPDEFQIERESSGHLGFGYGPHGCIGQQLARLEVAEAITQLLAAAPRIRLVHATQSEPLPFTTPFVTQDPGAVFVSWS